MTTDLRAAIDAWRDADADARTAEKLLKQTWQDHLDKRGPPVTDALVKEVAQFRARADNRLTLALALINSADAGSPSGTYTVST